MAVISLSAASRLRPSRMPTSTAMGMVTVNMLGSVKRTISTNGPSDALLRTTSSSRCGRSAHEQNEGEERAADEGVREDLFQDVSRQDAHRFELQLTLVYRGCKALQAQTVGEHADGAESHGGAGDAGLSRMSSKAG